MKRYEMKISSEILEKVKTALEKAARRDDVLIDNMQAAGLIAGLNRGCSIYHEALALLTTLQAATDAGEEVLPCPINVGAGKFGKGIKISTLQGAIDRAIKYRDEDIAALKSAQPKVEECKLPHLGLDTIATAIKKAEALGAVPKVEEVTVDEFATRMVESLRQERHAAWILDAYARGIATRHANKIAELFPNGIRVVREKEEGHD